jgi:GTPase
LEVEKGRNESRLSGRPCEFRVAVTGKRSLQPGIGTTSPDRRDSRPERAILVGVDFAIRARAGRAGPGSPRTDSGSRGRGQAGARAAVRLNCAQAEPDDESSTAPPGGSVISDPILQASSSPGLDLEESLAEFRELTLSAGAEVAAELIQRRPRPDPATLIGTGKVEEIAGVAASTQADLVLFDHNLSPTQLRNLEAALPCRVLDRTQLILDIFARHAHTREGQLQVELAQLEYMLPRLTGRGKSMSQLGGGIGTRGPGETQLETDRRRIQRRIDQLKVDLEAVRRVRRQQRQRRESVPVPAVALVGYTNAGKSTLFNRITGGHVLQSSQMFATLDPKLRAIELPSRRKALLSDTVGFIRNLPHTLVTSFRATLEEVEQAEVLLHIRDAASTYGDEQKAQVEKVLGELNALSKPRIEVLNKIDLLAPHEREGLASRLQSEARGIQEVFVSARTGEGIDSLLAAIDQALYSDPLIEAELRVPQHEGAALAAIEAGMVIHKRTYEGNAVHLTVAGPASLMGRFRQFRLANSA